MAFFSGVFFGISTRLFQWGNLKEAPRTKVFMIGELPFDVLKLKRKDKMGSL